MVEIVRRHEGCEIFRVIPDGVEWKDVHEDALAQSLLQFTLDRLGLRGHHTFQVRQAALLVQLQHRRQMCLAKHPLQGTLRQVRQQGIALRHAACMLAHFQRHDWVRLVAVTSYVSKGCE